MSIVSASTAVENAYLSLCAALGTLALELHRNRTEDIGPAQALADLWSGQVLAQRARGLRPLTGHAGFLNSCAAVPLVAGEPELGAVDIDAAAREA